MYQYHLKIFIMSSDKVFEEVMQSMKPLEGFTHEIHAASFIDATALRDSDIFVLDFVSKEMLVSIREVCKKNAKIVVCTNSYPEVYSVADEILLKPISKEIVFHCFEKILKQIKQDADFHYLNTCFQSAINSVPDMFWIKSLDGIHYMANDAFCETVGKNLEHIVGHDHCDIWNVSRDDPNNGAAECKKSEDAVIQDGCTKKSDECIKDVHGKEKQLITYKSPIYDLYGKPIGTTGWGHDITDFNNLSKENEALLDNLLYAVLFRDADGKIQNVNKCFEKWFHVASEDIVGTFYNDWIGKEFYPERTTNENGYIEGVTYPIEGEVKHFELRSSKIHDDLYLCTFNDVTRERNKDEMLLAAAYKDPMTNLYNRRYFDKVIAEQEEGTNLNLLAIDLDHFKLVNDNCGHEKGDEALILTANTLKECFPNDYVMRMGGDEFLVVKVGDYAVQELEDQAQILLNKLLATFGQYEDFKKLSASMGISRGVYDGSNIDELMKQSDTALYEAKGSGRACYCVYHKNRLVK